MVKFTPPAFISNIHRLSDAEGRPELQAGDGPKKSHAAASGTQKHRALPHRCRQAGESLQQIQGDHRLTHLLLILEHVAEVNK